MLIVLVTVAADASRFGIVAVMLKDQGGGHEQLSESARKLNPAERFNTYSAYDLGALAVYEAVKPWRHNLKGYSKFLIVTYHDKLRHPLR
jgi:hypothetical protein